jgi:hypothetical protein
VKTPLLDGFFASVGVFCNFLEMSGTTNWAEAIRPLLKKYHWQKIRQCDLTGDLPAKTEM